MANALPTARVSRWLPPMPGRMPSLISGWPNWALSAAMMMSQSRASSAAAPELPGRLQAEIAVQQDPDLSEEAFCASDVRFHRAIVDACGNVVIRLALYTVIEPLMPVTNMIITRSRRRSDIVERHIGLARAIEAGALDEAQAALADLIAYRSAEYAKVAKRR
jgi:DNA-binding FadR family transcriptional regulator